VASFAPRHTPTRTTLSLISPSRSATHAHLCGGHKSKTHELRGSPQFETDEIPTRALWTEAKATSPEEGEESREVQFRRSFLLGGHKHKEQTLFHSGRDALHMTTAAAGRRQARLDRDQHAAAFFQFQGKDPTPLPMLIILSQRYHTHTWHAKRRSAVCNYGMVAQKRRKKNAWKGIVIRGGVWVLFTTRTSC
jgi:hypothetical protein